ncbi:MAG: hypothetical protein ACJ8IK_28715 [Burkholderiaceae bacterium]
MSINSIANSAIARRSDMGVPNAVPSDYRQIALGARVMSAPVSTGSARPHEVIGATAAAAGPVSPGTSPAASSPATSAPAVDTALNVLFGYIPTEVVTLYVAVVAALHGADLQTQPGLQPQEATAIAFCVATPVVVWIIYATKLIGAGKRLPLSWGEWPLWEMIAATIAFAAWVVALPDAPWAKIVTVHQLSGVIVLVTSTALGLLSPLFQRPLKKGR